jgi:hypothetical protein
MREVKSNRRIQTKKEQKAKGRTKNASIGAVGDGLRWRRFREDTAIARTLLIPVHRDLPLHSQGRTADHGLACRPKRNRERKRETYEKLKVKREGETRKSGREEAEKKKRASLPLRMPASLIR